MILSDAPGSESPVITIDGSELEVRRWAGSGVPILMLHEGLGSTAMWRDFPDRLAVKTGRPVIAWSRQGYGSSDLLPKPRGPDYMHNEANLVPRVMDAIGCTEAILFGHSDGGSIALITAARFPDRVVALILEAPHVFVEQRTFDSIAQLKTDYRSSDMSSRLGRYHRDPDHVFWRWNDIWLDPRFRDWNIETLLPAVRAPTLLIQGRDDEYGTMEQLDRIQAGNANSRRLELSDCGHSPHRSQPDAVLAEVADFLISIDE